MPGGVAPPSRSVGLSTEDGFAAQLADSAQITEDAYRASGSDRLLLLSLQLRRAEADFITHRKVAAIGQFHDGFTELLSATRSSAALDSLGKRHLAELIGRYKHSFTDYVDATQKASDGEHAVAEAYEEARVAVEAALGLAVSRFNDYNSAIATLQKRTAARMLLTLAGAIIVVALLAPAPSSQPPKSHEQWPAWPPNSTAAAAPAGHAPRPAPATPPYDLALGSNIARPLERVAAATSRLARGEEQGAISDVTRRDEVGDVARALAVFRELTIEHRSLTHQRETRRNEGKRRVGDLLAAGCLCVMWRRDGYPTLFPAI